ncbi:MAG: PAS domain-containing protein [Candidatus Omnitrophica bacterium]|nr:PAS domain-containing protein [Candidatus Omnitrophota bacterium]
MFGQNGLPIPEILWHSCDGMMVIDERRRVLAMNPALERMTGRSKEEAVGKAECGILFSCRDRHGCSLGRTAQGNARA